MTPFYDEAFFWGAISTIFIGLFGLMKVYFAYKEKLIDKGVLLEASVERLRAQNIQKGVDYLNGVIARLEPMVLQHEAIMKELMESVKMVSVIEQGLRVQFGELGKKYDETTAQYLEIKNKITQVTSSFQLVMDRVDRVESRFAVGTVTRKP